MQCACKRPFEADGTGHCSNCGSLPPTAANDSPTDNLDAAGPPIGPAAGQVLKTDPDMVVLPIRLEYQAVDCHAGQHGCLPLRVTNRGSETIAQIELRAECTAFEKVAPIPPFIGQLRPSQETCRFSLDFDLQARYGAYLVRFEGYYLNQKQSPLAFCGQFMLQVGSVNDPRGKLIIEEGYGIDASNIVSAGTDVVIKGGYGISLSNAHGPHLPTGDWIEIKLEDAPERTDFLQRQQIRQKREAAIQQPGRSADTPRTQGPRAMRRCMLSLGDDEHTKRFHIWTRSSCTIGKQQSESDLICLCMPNEGDNQKRNALISRRHCRLSVKGNQVLVEDLQSTNGTSVNGHKITAPTALKNGQVLVLAGQLHLEYREFRQIDENRQVQQVFNTCSTMTQCHTALADSDLKHIATQAPLECFLLKRGDRFRRQLQYLFLRKAAMIGAARNAAIRLKHETVSDLHARLILDNQQLQVEDLNSLHGTFVDDQRLRPYVVTPLNHKAQLRFGEVAVGLVQLDF